MSSPLVRPQQGIRLTHARAHALALAHAYGYSSFRPLFKRDMVSCASSAPSCVHVVLAPSVCGGLLRARPPCAEPACAPLEFREGGSLGLGSAGGVDTTQGHARRRCHDFSLSALLTLAACPAFGRSPHLNGPRVNSPSLSLSLSVSLSLFHISCRDPVSLSLWISRKEISRRPDAGHQEQIIH